jgi:hypothetical protein
MDESKVRLLIHEMCALLARYESEIAAYHIVCSNLRNEAAKAGLAIDIPQALEAIACSQELQTKAEAEYAPFAGLLGLDNPRTLDSAIAEIRYLIAQRAGSPPRV